jgi:hypothetical protein
MYRRRVIPSASLPACRRRTRRRASGRASGNDVGVGLLRSLDRQARSRKSPLRFRLREGDGGPRPRPPGPAALHPAVYGFFQGK